MFRGSGNIFVYFVGVVVMFAVLLLLSRDFIPFIFSRVQVDPSNFTSLRKPQYTLVSKADYKAKFYTNKGEFTVDLFEANAPENVNNFVYLANLGYYTNTQFHRLVTNLLFQGGDRNTLNSDPNDDGKGYPGYTINDETNWESLNLSDERKNQLSNLGFSSNANLSSVPISKYSFAMANAGPNTNGSQFFIVTANFDDSRLSELNGKFTVIGKVVAGFDIIQAINSTPVDDSNSQNPRPRENLIITRVEVTPAK